MDPTFPMFVAFLETYDITAEQVEDENGMPVFEYAGTTENLDMMEELWFN